MKKCTIKAISMITGICLISAGLVACGSKSTVGTDPQKEKAAATAASSTPTTTPSATKAPTAAPAATATPAATPTAAPKAEATGQNLALNKTATASNSNSKGQPGGAVDGNLETLWRCNGPSDANTFVEFIVDFGAPTTFSKVVMKKLYNPQKYKAGSGKIEYSDDGKTWKQAAKVEKFEDNVTVDFTPVKGQFIRFYADKAGVDDNTIGFSEFEVYNAAK